MAKERKGILSAYAVFLVFNAAFFMMDTVNSYFSIYLNDLGFTKTMIGTVTTVSALTAMAMQPVFGAMLDRSASRTRVLQGLILLTAAMYPLLLLNSGFAYILAVYTVYNVFRRLQPAVNTALSELMALDFAIAELGLYLTTHRSDEDALELFRSYIRLANEGREKYVATYGPLRQTDMTQGDTFCWLNDPWPWEIGGND